MVLELVTFLTHVVAESAGRRLEIPYPLVGGLKSESSVKDARSLCDVTAADLKYLSAEVGSYFRSLSERHFHKILNPACLYHMAAVQIELTQKHGGNIVVVGNQHYPENLRAMVGHPLALFTLGTLDLLATRKMAVIGSRRANQKASLQSFLAGGILAELGFSICSGGAFGCDIAAHEGVLARKKIFPIPAICVFASGLQTFYPRANAPVFSSLKERGGLFLSEKLWGETCRPRNFPTRNRIICGLSESVFLMQAAEKSGSMVSARIAAQEGRDLFVLTHDSDDVTAAGGFKLIEDGATPFDHVEEVVHAFC